MSLFGNVVMCVTSIQHLFEQVGYIFTETLANALVVVPAAE